MNLKGITSNIYKTQEIIIKRSRCSTDEFLHSLENLFKICLHPKQKLEIDAIKQLHKQQSTSHNEPINFPNLVLVHMGEIKLQI